MKLAQIEIDMFSGLDIYMIIGTTNEKNAWILREFGVEEEQPENFVLWHTLQKKFVVGLEINPSNAIIVHESYHLMMNIMDCIEAKSDVDNQEWSAYLIETIYRKIEQIVIKSKKGK